MKCPIKKRQEILTPIKKRQEMPPEKEKKNPSGFPHEKKKKKEGAGESGSSHVNVNDTSFKFSLYRVQSLDLNFKVLSFLIEEASQ